MKLQLHKYSADTFRNNPWTILISEREKRETDRVSEREGERDSTLIPGFSVHMYTSDHFLTLSNEYSHNANTEV